MQILNDIKTSKDFLDVNKYENMKTNNNNCEEIINELNEIIGSNFIDSEVSTIGGFLINKINKLPAVDEEFDIDEYKIQVIETNETRILRLKIIKK